MIDRITTEQYEEFRRKLNVVDSLIMKNENIWATGLVDEVIVQDHEG